MGHFGTRKSMAKAALAAFVMLVVGSRAMPAEAHAIGLSTGEYTAKGSSVVGKLAFARGEVASLAPGIDTNHDGHLTPSEVESSRTLLRDKVIGRISVSAGGARCAPVLTDAGLTEQDGLLLTGRWDCKSDDKPFELELTLLDDLARGHRHIARSVAGATTHDEVLFGEQRKLTLTPEGSAPARTADAKPHRQGASPPDTPDDARLATRYALLEPRGTAAGFWSFFKMGIEHILTGYDHLVFILGLVLARARLRSLLTIVTAFTVAHSITLALAVLGVWAPSPRIVEPAIALSIAYVGIENFFVKDASKRWRITFPFGLIHGFGFAGALQEIALPRGSVPTALVSFNLGVECGQLAVLAVLLPLVLFLRETNWFEPRGARIVSGAVALAGGIWFVSRVISG